MVMSGHPYALSSPRPSGSTAADADHQRAEALLASVEGITDGSRRRRAEQEAVLLTLDLADSVALRYRGRGIDVEDLLQVARMALVKAARGYHHGQGSCFAAYAVPTIAGEVKRCFRDCGWAVRPPRRLQELRARLPQEEERLRQQLHREPSAVELSAALEVPLRDVHEAQECCAAYRALSLEAPAPSGAAVADGVSGGVDEFTGVELRVALGKAMAGLTPRDQEILTLRFVHEHSQSEIGEALGISQMQVSRLLARLLHRLRDELESAGWAA